MSGAVAAGIAATGALAGCTSQPSEPPRRSSTRDTATDGLTAYSMATHVHSSFSEMNGSMDSQLFQATKNSVDVLWWTEHDQRMLGLDYARAVNFTSLARAPGKLAKTGLTDGAAWLWQHQDKGRSPAHPRAAWSAAR